MDAKHALQFFKLSIDMLCVATPQGYFVELNDLWTETLGWSKEELMARPFYDFIHKDDLEKTTRETTQLGQGINTVRFENRYLHKDGSYRNFLWNGAFSQENQLIYGIARDITELKHTERKAHLALKAIKMGMWEWNLKQNTVEWDDSLFDLYGIEKKTFSGAYEAWEHTVHPEDKVRTLKELQEALEDKKEFDTNFRVTTAQGKIKIIGAKGFVERGPRDEPLSMIGVNWDLTKLFEQELLIKQQQAKIISSAKMSSLGQMAGGIAHEINNPLSIIQARASLLKKKLITKENDITSSLTDIEKIEATSQRIFKIIKGLRTFSRNAENDPFMPVDIKSLTEDTFELCRERFKNNNINLKIKDEIKGNIECRPTLISQVLLNLLNNAFDAVFGKQTPWVEVELKSQDDKLVILVSDSGPQITADVAGQMMQPFFTTKDVGQGMGLGLSISKGIIEDHNGQLWFDEKAPHTLFVVEIPWRQNKLKKKVDLPSL